MNETLCLIRELLRERQKEKGSIPRNGEEYVEKALEGMADD